MEKTANPYVAAGATAASGVLRKAVPFMGRVVGGVKNIVKAPAGPAVTDVLGSKTIAATAKPVAAAASAAPAVVKPAAAARPHRISAEEVRANLGRNRADIANSTAEFKSRNPKTNFKPKGGVVAPGAGWDWQRIKNHPAAVPVAAGAGGLLVGGMLARSGNNQNQGQ